MLVVLQDPIGEGSPLEEWSVKGVSSLPGQSYSHFSHYSSLPLVSASAPAYDGEPVFELSLGNLHLALLPN